jgi:hypothetical protein
MNFCILVLVDPCDSSPCENNGTCVNTENTFKCTCTEKYEGATCGNKGLFVKNVVILFFHLNQQLLFSLILPLFWLLFFFWLESTRAIVFLFDWLIVYIYFYSVNPCEVNPCLNGGECLSDLSEFTTSCTCPDGYEGDTCQNRGNMQYMQNCFSFKFYLNLWLFFTFRSLPMW